MHVAAQTDHVFSISHSTIIRPLYTYTICTCTHTHTIHTLCTCTHTIHMHTHTIHTLCTCTNTHYTHTIYALAQHFGAAFDQALEFLYHNKLLLNLNSITTHNLTALS